MTASRDARVAEIRRSLRHLVEEFEAKSGSRLEEWRSYRRVMMPRSPLPPLTVIRGRRPRPRTDPVADEATADEFAFMTCAHAMLESLDRIPALNVPDELKTLVIGEFAARCEDGLARRHARYSLRDVEGWNQLAASRLQRLPLGLYDFNLAGIPKSNLLRCPWSEKAALATFLAFRMKGLSPVFEVHLPRLSNRHVSEDEVDASHLLLARVARMNPGVKGLYSSAWYIDPAVAAINPRLAFLREFFLRNGGFVHRIGVTQSSVEDALRKSETRRRLYAEGRYQPAAWARYWPRAAMLRWAGLH